MAAERFRKSLIKRRGGGGGVSFNSHNFSTVDPMSKFLGFSESLENYLSNDVFQSKISLGALICHFSASDHGL